MRFTIDDLHKYAMGWYTDDQWTDLNMALDSGYTDLALSILDSAGAINSRLCYEDAKSIEQAIEKRLEKYTQKMRNKESKECFGKAIVYVHNQSNEHAFIKNEHVDYLVTHEEMLKYGYISADVYYKEAK